MSRSRIRPLLALLAAFALLALPTAAASAAGGAGAGSLDAQMARRKTPGLKKRPPIKLPHRRPRQGPARQPAKSNQRVLAKTGAEPALVALAGAGLLLCGVGMRMRLRVDGA
ncbi:MAG TPA: hypothetical protein VHE14_02230 [Solirubrobacteraceae bacterium]|nr:hypothetical protein [Solirubrobacteraceae bacterium]